MNKKYWLFGIIIILIIIAGFFLIKDKSGESLAASVYRATKTTQKASTSFLTADSAQIATNGQQAAVPGGVPTINSGCSTLYLMGGHGGNQGATLFHDVWAFNQNTNTWSQIIANAPWVGRTYHASLFFNNKLWIMGGSNFSNTHLNDVWSSVDGVTWIQVTPHAPWSGRAYFGSVVFNNKMWVMGGVNFSASTALNDIWSSSDGINWVQVTANAPWGDRHGFATLVFDNKIWVMGGQNLTGGVSPDVWSSSDGINWVQVTNTVPWISSLGQGRNNFASTVFNNKMWVMGGNSPYTSNGNDVWSSTDGVSWIQVNVAASWSKREEFPAVTLGNKMWIMGGLTTSNPNMTWLNDIWSSSDGLTWNQAVANASWSVRDGHTLVCATLPPSAATPFPGGGPAPVQLLPDLIVTSLTWTPSTPSVTQPDKYINFRVIVKNIGQVSTTLPAGTRVKVYKGSVTAANAQAESFTLPNQVTLAPNQSYTFNMTTYYNASILQQAGTFNVIAYADSESTGSGYTAPGFAVAESNETNNSMTLPITITP